MASLAGNYVVYEGFANHPFNAEGIPPDLVIALDGQGNLVNSTLRGQAISGRADPATNGITFAWTRRRSADPIFETIYEGFPLCGADGQSLTNANGKVTRLAGTWTRHAFALRTDDRGGWWARVCPGFAADIRPLFRDKDIDGMAAADDPIDLTSYEEVMNRASEIYRAVAFPTPSFRMPCDGPWPVEYVETFKFWIDDGMRP